MDLVQSNVPFSRNVHFYNISTGTPDLQVDVVFTVVVATSVKDLRGNAFAATTVPPVIWIVRFPWSGKGNARHVSAVRAGTGHSI